MYIKMKEKKLTIIVVRRSEPFRILSRSNAKSKSERSLVGCARPLRFPLLLVAAVDGSIWNIPSVKIQFEKLRKFNYCCTLKFIGIWS